MGKKWTAADIANLPPGMVSIGKQIVSLTEPAKLLKKLTAEEPAGLVFIKNFLQGMGIAYDLEYRFAPGRKFRFDIAIFKLKTYVEYEGIYSEKSRHTTFSGYSKDVEKYNLATTLGWKGLRYTADNYRDFENDITHLINNHETKQSD